MSPLQKSSPFSSTDRSSLDHREISVRNKQDPVQNKFPRWFLWLVCCRHSIPHPNRQGFVVTFMAMPMGSIRIRRGLIRRVLSCRLPARLTKAITEMEGNANTVHSNDNGKEKKPTDINHSGFENHAETAWLQMRKQWAGDCSQKPEGVPKDPVLSWTTTYEDLLLSTEPFHQPIPLAEMVDFLVDSWHEDEPDD